MASTATTPDEYLNTLPTDRKEALTKLRNIILQNLPKGFDERMSYGMVGYVVPHETFPAGYHCDPKLPLPFLNMASQKNFIALYHMGLYADKNLYDWFVAEYPKHSKTKLDMGKSCIRFKKMDAIPYELIAELVQKMSVSDWVTLYQRMLQR
ncbi:DUF1801 domain-containing protein [Flavobacterium sp.]|uniref:DUF1801 domain-containing protein n=1 Tax=Flavobacterium sp. TaxID=239 RepID=UPI0039E3227B